MSDFENKKLFFKNNKCPLCRSIDFERSVSNYKNVYSELIAKYINFEEDDLLHQNNILICNNCGLIYWEYAISKNLRKKLYGSILSNHPKGIDSAGILFNFHKMLERLKNIDNLANERKRIIQGYFSSMIFNNNLEEEKTFDILNSNNLIIENNVKFLEKIFKRGPKYLSRYVGFRDTIINQLIYNIFSKEKNIINYIEYGCTSWGPIHYIIDKGFQCLSIIPLNHIFWDCSDHASNINAKNYKIINEKFIKENTIYIKNSILNLILVLDHIDNPYRFLMSFIKRGVKFIFIILEKSNEDEDNDLPIQHLTGWNKTSLIHLATKLKSNIEFIDLKSNLFLAALIKIK